MPSRDQQFRDLDAVERGALAQLIADHPEVDAVGGAEVLADSADEAVVLALDEDRHRVAVLRGIVVDAQSREALERLARLAAVTWRSVSALTEIECAVKTGTRTVVGEIGRSGMSRIFRISLTSLISSPV